MRTEPCSLPEPIAIVAHDAGGAEVLSSYVRQHPADYRMALAGPARLVFERKLGSFRNLTVRSAVQSCACVLCGTGWHSDTELIAIAEARRQGKPSIAWLDHWVNYRERFTRGAALCLPDEVWVGDPAALSLALQWLPEVPIRQMENPYFADLAAELATAERLPAPERRGVAVLYVGEPVREAAYRQFGDPLHWGYSEESALRYFLDHTDALGAPVSRISIRRHPAEPEDKYRDVAAAYHLPVEFTSGRPLIADIAAGDCVAGCGSMAMVVGLLANKRVICSIPPGGAACPLPQRTIEMLRDLVRGQ